MNKEQLEQRLRQLELERISMISTYDGAIQDCKYWLENLEKEDNAETVPEQSS